MLATSRTSDVVISPDSPLHTRFDVLALAGLPLDSFREFLVSQGIRISDTVLSELHGRLQGSPLGMRTLLMIAQEGGLDDASIVDLLGRAYAAKWPMDVSNVLVLPTDRGLRAIPAARGSSHAVFTPSAELFVAAPYVHVRRHAHYWSTQFERFNELLNDSGAKEGHFQDFFERNPEFLLGIDYERAIAHPVLIREGEGPLIPDFFLQPLDGALCDILDLKLPTHTVVVGPKNRLRLSSKVHEAIAQVREYRDYFEDPKYREAVKAKYGVTAYRPALCVAIGRTPRHVSEEKYRQILAGTAGIRLVTYDELQRKMRRMVEIMSL